MYDRREPLEEQIITYARCLDGFRHRADDCGTVSGSEIRLSLLGSPILGMYNDALFSLQVSNDIYRSRTWQEVVKEAQSEISLYHLRVKKAETTFVEGQSYGVFGVVTGEQDPNHETIASIDTAVAGRHFLLEYKADDAGFYSACSSVSDIGANGGEPTLLRVMLLNAGDIFARNFERGIAEACEFLNCGYSIRRERQGTGIAAVCAALGKVEKGKQLHQRGAERGMNLYVAGTLGGAAFANYVNYNPVLKRNLSPPLRRRVIEAVDGDGICTDVSDGLRKSLNLLSGKLKYELEKDALQQVRHHSHVTKEQMMVGGDDYALLIGTHRELDIPMVHRIGRIK